MSPTVILLVVAGFVVLVLGGEILVAGARRLSLRLRVPPAVVGATVVALATSAPELAVSVGATLHGDPALALGNVVGSNIANVLLVMGLGAVVSPILATPRLVRVEMPVCIGVTVLLALMALDGMIGRLDGLVLVAALVANLWRSAHMARLDSRTTEDPSSDPRESGGALRGVAAVVAGALALVLGAELLVQGASEIAGSLGVSEFVVGLTVVAIGTSLPELAAAISAGRKAETDLTAGNAVGSNLANIGLVLGVPALFINPIPVPAGVLAQDLPLAILAVLVLWLITRRKGRVGRAWGLTLALGYVGYLTAVVLQA